MKLNVITRKSKKFAENRYVIVAFISSILVMLSCAFQYKKDAVKNDSMNAKEALTAAIKYFPEEKYGAITNYRLGITDGDNEWQISFNKQNPMAAPGEHLLIFVSKEKGEIKIMPGE